MTIEDDRDIQLDARLNIKLTRPAGKWLMSCPELGISDHELACGRASMAAEASAVAEALRLLAEAFQGDRVTHPAVHRTVRSFRG